jgi:NAD(P)-dependent dehydrogenase (short-subunit alcohol dehydrogenase family)
VGVLTDKVVVISGAAHGIGRAAALACAREGAALLVNDVGCDATGAGHDPEALLAVVQELRALGAKVEANHDDVTRDETPGHLVSQAVSAFGRLDAVFASAGIAFDRVLVRVDDADLDRVLDLHLRAPLRLARAAAQSFQARAQPGSILLTTAQAAFVGARGQSIYAAAAAGIAGFTRAAALELRRHGVRVNALAPLARTRATADLPIFQSVRKDSLTAEHVAQAVTFLLSPAAAEISGDIVGVAGSRVYTLRLHETTGAFLEGPLFGPDDVARAWSTVTRG